MKVETVTSETFHLVLPLIADYQRFYSIEPDEARNRQFFAQFLMNHADGVQFMALDESGRALGFATLYFPLSSASAGAVCLMNDLFTIPEVRGRGIGRALMRHCLEYAKEHGYSNLQWRTEQSNDKAQRLYQSMGVEPGAWFIYVLPIL